MLTIQRLYGTLSVHVAAVFVFALSALLFCHPVLEGKRPEQPDLAAWHASARQTKQVAAATGRAPLWNISLFSGMPNYMTYMNFSNAFTVVSGAIQDILPQPVRYFFWAAVCFYLFGLMAGLSPPIAVFAAVAYAYNTYHPIILHTGHLTKMQALVYLPLLMAGVTGLWMRKYRAGTVLSLLGATLLLGSYHLQVTYYAILLAGCVSTGFGIQALYQKQFRHLLICVSVLAGSALMAAAVNASTLLTARELARTSIRGGSSVRITADTVIAVQSKGVSADYAFQYSFRKAEPLVLLLPGLFGGSSSEPLADDTKVIEQLLRKGANPVQARQIADQIPRYWGGLEATDGPPYLGALVVLLAILGFAIVSTPLTRALLAAVLLGIVLSWGKYLPGINSFLLDYLPFYNKFRAPSMAIVLLQAALPMAAGLFLQQVAQQTKNGQWQWTDFLRVRNVLGVTGGLLLVLFALFDYSAPIDELVMKSTFDASGVTIVNSSIIAGLRQDRVALFQQSLLRLLPFLLLLPALAWLLTKKWVPPVFTFGIVFVVATADLFATGWQHLSPASYVEPELNLSPAQTVTETDRKILADTVRTFRVFYAGSDRFTATDFRTTAHHQSVGGYHAAKLRIYQDVLERYLRDSVYGSVLNMLNTRYIIYPKAGGDSLLKNAGAWGPCWLTSRVTVVENDADALQAIGRLPLRETALVHEPVSFNHKAASIDSKAFIHLMSYSNDQLRYSASCRTPQFAVFSEVFYPFGWKAYLNGKQVPVYRTNYVLRGMPLPAGTHQIEFRFEPESYAVGQRIASAAAWLLWLLLALLLFLPVIKQPVIK